MFHGYVWPDDSVFADHTRPEVREWWGDMQKALVDVGVCGIWNDMNEPTVFDRPFSQGNGQAGTIDLDAIQGPEGERTIHAEVHNLYGYGMARTSYEGLRRYLCNERPFVLIRHWGQNPLSTLKHAHAKFVHFHMSLATVHNPLASSAKQSPHPFQKNCQQTCDTSKKNTYLTDGFSLVIFAHSLIDLTKMLHCINFE